MDDTRARWVYRKVIDDDIYYDRKTRTVYRGINHSKFGAREKVYTSPAFKPEAPIKVYFDPSYYCCLECRHCITNSSAQVDRMNELRTRRILAILDELANIGVLEVTVGGGEPLCYPDLYLILERMSALGINVVLDTNGMLVTPYVANRLTDIGLSEIRVSFEGWQQFHDSVRGRNTYQRAIEAVAILSRSGQTTVPRLTLCRGSELGLEQLFKDLALAGAKVLKVCELKNAGRASLPENQGLIRYSIDNATVAHLRDIARKHGIMLKMPIYFPVTTDEMDGGDLRVGKHLNCGAGLETGYISPSGNIYPCSSMPQYTFGELATMSFMDAWTSNSATRYRQMVLSNESCHKLCNLRDLPITSNIDTTQHRPSHA